MCPGIVDIDDAGDVAVIVVVGDMAFVVVVIVVGDVVRHYRR